MEVISLATGCERRLFHWLQGVNGGYFTGYRV